jgi:hypothetical protein
MKYYKVLGKGGVSCNGGDAKWSIPHDGEPGDWMPEIIGELIPCKNGYHLCRTKDLVVWLNDEIYEAEFEGEIIESDDKVVVRKARLLRKLKTWDEKTTRLFAAECAERVLHLYEEKYPDDNRPRLAIEASREYANGKISAAASAAASNSAWAAASAAKSNSAWTASAWAAASAAKSNSAWAAASAAAWAADRDSEKAWQTKRFLEYLEER